ncbi:uncharacterized protein [Blastocystis hominis]|uniref:PD-(D/E)XK endonuclease-like domain-containing protein n=1 Tax=Blastocystis hominis TaxID=12968 RepID=D8LVK9_BLAHO|nr:uncharacterized protein [Blastocystis hominis]CBK19848.2 unnamed protein product [Blastocystis hominis]|eukprot:XP_012893896.1 uncharacterized protein [Blastocystis hominis]
MNLINQVLLLQKKQPHRIFTEDDLYFLKRIAESSPQQELQKKAFVGNETHALLSQIIAGKDIKGKPKFEPFISGYKLWRKANNIDIYFTDVFVKSEKYGFCGFIDAVGTQEDGKLFILDFKSGSGIYDSYAIQIAAYCKAFEEYYDAVRVPNFDFSELQISTLAFLTFSIVKNCTS